MFQLENLLPELYFGILGSELLLLRCVSSRWPPSISNLSSSKVWDIYAYVGFFNSCCL